ESSSQYFDDWTVWINGTQVAFSGTVAPIQFSHSDWESGVSKTVLIETDILQIEPLGPRAEWLATYGPAWLALFVAVGFIGLIIASFYRGVKKRKGKGKVWKFMPRKFR
ncbi:MAG: hypothetical protein GTO63_30445, partial [Anaerolineae bacterium]|nr:hypothetical protein [Anaerolineae bacterium]NIN99020.1 hypothetical protein [Anaerolineae bacterium]